MRRLILLNAAWLLSLAASFADAHHSFAMFDRSKELTLTGTVKEFQFTNPHSWIHLLVKDSQNNETLWTLEGGSISQLVRNGWTNKSIKEGDQITVKVFPRRDSQDSGDFHEITTSDGKTLSFSPRY